MQTFTDEDHNICKVLNIHVVDMTLYVRRAKHSFGCLSIFGSHPLFLAHIAFGILPSLAVR